MTQHPPAANPPLIVIGASVRALAASARRAGWSVHAADLFADSDLRATATTTVRVPVTADLPWPDGVARVLHWFPRAPWLYSGALENHPDLVDRLALGRPLAGNPGAALRAVRDPARLARAVRGAGLSFPDTFASPDRLPVDGSFLVKPLAGAGGRGVAAWHGGPAIPGRIWQRRVRGRARSATYVLGAGGPRLCGASRQLIGRRWCGARGFAWCGAVDVPLAALEPRLRARLDDLGSVLAGEFGLVGLVGVDLVVEPAGNVHVIEVNPRPTASMELLERATGASLVATHLAACGVGSPAAPAPRADRVGIWAKAVLFGERRAIVTERTAAALEDLARRWTDADGGWPPLADLPVVGSALEPGRPALTVFASGDPRGAALRTLGRRVAAVREALRRAPLTPPCDAGAPRRPPHPGSTA